VAVPVIRAYIAGPISAPTIYQYRRNIERAKDASLILMQQGYATHCPAAETAYFDGALAYEQFMEIDFAWLEVSDVIVLLPGLFTSFGACLEYQEARRRGLMIYRYEHPGQLFATTDEADLKYLDKETAARISRGRG
jgi:hypothetical protein